MNWIFFIAISIWLILWFGIKWWFFSRRVVAEVLPTPGVPFQLHFSTDEKKKMSMRFEFDFAHGGGEDDFGAVIELYVDINGEITEDIIGIGERVHMKVNRVVKGFLMGRDSHSPKGARSKATVIPVEFVLNPGNEVYVKGTVHLEPETKADHMRIYVVE